MYSHLIVLHLLNTRQLQQSYIQKCKWLEIHGSTDSLSFPLKKETAKSTSRVYSGQVSMLFVAMVGLQFAFWEALDYSLKSVFTTVSLSIHDDYVDIFCQI